MLNKTAIEKAKPGEKRYLLPDGDGLYLRVSPSGSKKWLVRFWANGRDCKKTIGEYPAMGLAAARLEKNRYKAAIAEERERPSSITFGELSRRWLEDYSSTLSEGSRYNHALYMKYLPGLMGRRVCDLRRIDLVEALETVRKEHSYETARRVAVVIGQIYSYALNRGIVQGTPAANLSSALIAKAGERKGKKHFAAVTDREGIGRLLRAMDTISSGTARRALWFMAYTFPRTGELRKAMWPEVDLGGRMWTVPAEHTKRRKELVVPLSRQALSLLLEQKASVPGAYLFSSSKGGMLSPGALIYSLKGLRALPDGERSDEMTMHGFRAMASTVLNTSGLWTPDAIERQLSHSPEDAVRDAYNRSDYLEERIRMMQWYADELDAIKRG